MVKKLYLSDTLLKDLKGDTIEEKARKYVEENYGARFLGIAIENGETIAVYKD